MFPIPAGNYGLLQRRATWKLIPIRHCWYGMIGLRVSPQTLFMIRILTIIFVCLVCLSTVCQAQPGSSQNLYFVPKNGEARFERNDYQPGKNAFYIYRNCIYDLVLKNNQTISIRVVDIRNDSIYYTSAFRHTIVVRNNWHIDTLALHPMQLKKIRLIGDRLLGLYGAYSLTKCRYVFEKNDAPKLFPIERSISYAADSSYSVAYELVAYLTAQGLDKVYEQRGISYYKDAAMPGAYKDTAKKNYYTQPAPKKRPRLVKNIAWYTPSKATEINGLTMGLQTTFDDENPLAINGVNLNADGLSAFIGMFAMVYMFTNTDLDKMSDTLNKSNINSSLNGLSISAGGLLNSSMRVRGVSINGVVSSANEMVGLHITGTQNITETFKGVVITGIVNRTLKGRGLQIALFNVCKDLKGVQLGLWNVNSKRSLPFINWRF